MKYRIIENDKVKLLLSEPIKSFFDKKTGETRTWGKTKDDDPDLCVFGPLIADIEISTVCSQGCKECYKQNLPEGTHMSLTQFRAVLAKLPRTLQQIAFGLGDTPSLKGGRGNPDTFSIFEFTRSQGVIPNATINGFGLDRATAEQLALVLGACAVSRYTPKDICYDAVAKLADAGLVQTNIHQICSVEHFGACMELLGDAKTDPRLEGLNAIVFLAGKKKGRGKWLTPVPVDMYKRLVEYALEKGVHIGFDSCSAWKFLDAVKDSPLYKEYQILAEPCESGLFSAYIDVTGTYYPCSFSPGLVKGIDLFGVKDFMQEVWLSQEVEEWRKRLLGNCRQCPLFEI
jgi:hypothetical protein